MNSYILFKLVPPNRMKQQMSTVPTELSPVVGVSVVLRKEDMVCSEIRGSLFIRNLGSKVIKLFFMLSLVEV